MSLVQERELSKADPVLRKIIIQVPKPIIYSSRNVYHDLMSCVLEQQIHYRSTKRIFEKALERAGIDIVSPENFHLLEQHALPHLKLAMGKYETLLSLNEYWSNNNLDFFQLPDEEIISQLSSIKGIGRWTIDMILLYTLGRPNVFPVDDYHLKQIMVSHYGLDPKVKLKAEMNSIANQWGYQKSLAVLYLLAWKLQQKPKLNTTF